MTASRAGDAPAPIDAGLDGPVVPLDASAQCSPTAPFGPRVVLKGLALSGLDEKGAGLSADERTIYFDAFDPAVFEADDLYVATRAAPSDNFSAPISLAAENSAFQDGDPEVTADGTTLYFTSNRVANQGYHILFATRPPGSPSFGTPAVVDMVDDADVTKSDTEAFATVDGKELWFASNRSSNSGAFHIFRTSITAAGFTTPAMEPALSLSTTDTSPVVSADRLTIYFASQSTAAGTMGKTDIWMSHRTTVTDPFPTPTPVTTLNTSANDVPTWISADECRLYGYSDSSGHNQIFVAARQPQSTAS